MKSAIAMSNCVRARGPELTPPSNVNCVSFATRDFFEEGGGRTHYGGDAAAAASKTSNAA